MMFLMNDVVLDLDARSTPPLPAARSHALSLQSIIKLGSELYAAHPRLQHTDPEKARRLAMLILAKAPDVNAALFVAPADKCTPDQVVSRFANLSFEVIAGLFSQQEAGALNAVTADREVWRRLAA